MLLLALVIAIVWGVLQLTGSDDDPAPKAAPKPSATTAKPTPSSSPTAAPEPRTTVDGLVDVSLVSASAKCDPEKVRITPSVRPGQLTRGVIDINLVVSTTQTTACTLQPDDAEAIAVIAANGTPVWDSTVCKTSLLSAPVQLTPQWATLAPAQWTGRGSGSNCTSNQAWASPGRYTLEIGTLGGEPGKTSFTLDARPAPVQTTPPPTPAPAATADPAAPAAPPDPAATQAPAAGSDVPAPLPEGE